jgi:hypothetical protein
MRNSYLSEIILLIKFALNYSLIKYKQLLMKKVMVLGAYGNFGKIISNALARHKTPLILAGKNI